MTHEQHEKECRDWMRDNWRNIRRGIQGHEFWRQLGEIRHVYAFSLKDGRRMRFVGPAVENPGMYSDRETWEKEVTA